MDNMLKITAGTLSTIFTTIKNGITSIAQEIADKKDNAIIAAALSEYPDRIIKFGGIRSVSASSIRQNSITISSGVLYSICYNSTTNTFILQSGFYYYNNWTTACNYGSKATTYGWTPYEGALYKDASDNVYYATGGKLQKATTANLITAIDNGYCNSAVFIDKKYWSTLTPIVDGNSQISAIYKGETVGDFTKWIIMLNTGSDCETEDQNYTAYKKGNTRYVYGTHSYYYEMYNKPWELWLPSDATAGSVIIDI